MREVFLHQRANVDVRILIDVIATGQRTGRLSLSLSTLRLRASHLSTRVPCSTIVNPSLGSTCFEYYRRR